MAEEKYTALYVDLAARRAAIAAGEPCPDCAAINEYCQGDVHAPPTLAEQIAAINAKGAATQAAYLASPSGLARTAFLAARTRRTDGYFPTPPSAPAPESVCVCDADGDPPKGGCDACDQRRHDEEAAERRPSY